METREAEAQFTRTQAFLWPRASPTAPDPRTEAWGGVRASRRGAQREGDQILIRGTIGNSGSKKNGESEGPAPQLPRPSAKHIPRASIGQVCTRHLAPAAPASRPSLPTQFHDCACHSDSALQFYSLPSALNGVRVGLPLQGSGLCRLFGLSFGLRHPPGGGEGDACFLRLATH